MIQTNKYPIHLRLNLTQTIYNFLPSDIIGSIVNEWPGFITPIALFSATKIISNSYQYHKFN